LDGVVASELDVVECLAAAQYVVGDVVHVIRLEIGFVDLEELDVRVDAFREPQLSHESMDKADAAVRDRLGPVGELVADVAGREHRAVVVDLNGVLEQAAPWRARGLSNVGRCTRPQRAR
jgi:hypothetical protein